MTVKLEAEGVDYFEAMMKLGMRERSPIEIRFPRRHGDYLTDGGMATGFECIVDVQGEGQREFPTSDEALAHLAELLRKRDEHIKKVAEQARAWDAQSTRSKVIA